ncbi:3174_t:CDS:2, partial [Diversispora eburnea]
MSRKIEFCPAGHSSVDFVYSDRKNYICSGERCDLCTIEHFVQEFKTWSIKRDWNFIKQDWEYHLIGHKVSLKEIKGSGYDIAEFLKVATTIHEYYEYISKYYGISKNPSTQNYIIVMDLFDGDLNNFITNKFWDLGWESKIDILLSITWGLGSLHEKDFIHSDLHSGNILINDNDDFDLYNFDLRIDLDSLDNNVMRQLKVANENLKNISKSQKQELFELFLYSSKLHPQSCYFSRYIHTLHVLHDLLDEIKSGKSS